jgi:tRNA-uridine 2-sulfurtransferase
MMMRLWSEPGNGDNPPANRCCTAADGRRPAHCRPAEHPLLCGGCAGPVSADIVQFFIEEHERGRTPNPCIECNRQIRFTYLLNQALALEANYLATGHYARVEKTAVGYLLRQGIDSAQGPVLRAAHADPGPPGPRAVSLLATIRRMRCANWPAKFKLPVASKSDSQDLCFLGDGDYRRFLRQYSEQADRPGQILTEGWHGTG